MYGKLNRYSEAETHFKKAIKLLNVEVQAIHYANLGKLTIPYVCKILHVKQHFALFK